MYFLSLHTLYKAMAKRKNKQRGGWTKDGTDNRRSKAENIYYLKMSIMRLMEAEEDTDSAYDTLQQYIEQLENEAIGKEDKSIYFFTPEEVKKTNDEIPDCHNDKPLDGHLILKLYMSDLEWLYNFFDDTPTIQNKIVNLLHDLCPEKTLVAKVVPNTYEMVEALPGFDENLPFAVAEPIYDGGRKRKSRRCKTRSRRRRTLRRSR
jgi:hypothetical protein